MAISLGLIPYFQTNPFAPSLKNSKHRLKMSAKLQLSASSKYRFTEDESDGSNSSSSQDNMALDQKEISQATAAADGEWDQIETAGNLLVKRALIGSFWL